MGKYDNNQTKISLNDLSDRSFYEIKLEEIRLIIEKLKTNN